MSKRFFLIGCFLGAAMGFYGCSQKEEASRIVLDFNEEWSFYLGERDQETVPVDDTDGWRVLSLPHDWSIEGDFSPDHPAGTGGGALPGGIGWYQKSFNLDERYSGKRVFIEFDGIYQESDVWINGEHLGFRPNGYISFQYDLTPFLYFGEQKNILTVKVDNSKQPNSRWYSGSGIYRNVRLSIKEPLHIAQWGVWITTPEIHSQQARVAIETTVRNDGAIAENIELETEIYDPEGVRVSHQKTGLFTVDKDGSEILSKELTVPNPRLWSDRTPERYTAVTRIFENGRLSDETETVFGIRDFHFDAEKGFFLNGVPTKIKGVCNHHDLGALGAAVNRRALERQLEIMKEMGVNAIRTAHNPPDPQLLELADEMGFIVMNEMFDVWVRPKAEYDYHRFFEEWHEKDLRDFVLRDRNHPSVIMWSIGNEILEQWHPEGETWTRRLADIVKELDPTRPITAGLNHPQPDNSMIQSGALDLIGYNYSHEEFESFPDLFPGKVFIGAETTSALATRGYYEMPSDTIRRWPYDWRVEFTEGNPDHTVSAYDHVSTPWGSTHRESLKPVMEHDFLTGMFVWTGFDYLGEPTPYGWPSRSSYFGIVDLAGFPKDAFYLYQSQWTDEPVLHVFPHWNWEEGDVVDVWVYTNLEEVELFLNGESLGAQRMKEGRMHLSWRVDWVPGTIKATGRAGEDVISTERTTAGPAAQLELDADRTMISADGNDLSFVTVRVLDSDGNMVPDASNRIHFEVDGSGFVAAVDNGNPVSHEPFQATFREAFNGKALAIIRSDGSQGDISVRAVSDGLRDAEVVIQARP
ncbi:beta-galactosidase GalB [Balneolaceae bacterium ANBcel3]|nr:beta-galactosidase GalB [Balneolaceae bacterium ANBcel3]